MLTDKFAALLSTVRTPGDFCSAGVRAMPLPGLVVEGVGPIALPLLQVQADQLIAIAERAPFGRGEETLVDTEVRRTWQIAPERVRIDGRHWAQGLQAIVEQVRSGLGVTGTVVAELYKLLVYDQGSFFVSHRDTEKAPGMFATLVIALPSHHAGGELLVRHQGRELRLGLQCPDPGDVAFAAFYADCTHEVLPVTSGCRLVLVYNLLRKGAGKLPQPPSYPTETAGVASELQQWSEGKRVAGDAAGGAAGGVAELAPDDSPDKLVYPLEHAYTPAELSFQALKGADAAVAAVLVDAAAQAGCDLHVALLTVEESGSAEQTGYSRSRRWGRDGGDDEGFEIGEVFDRSLMLSHWSLPDGRAAGLGGIPFADPEICPADALQDMEPDEQYFQEATGNEGASFDRTYRRAALVLWPRHRRLAVLNQAGLAATLPWLDLLAGQWLAEGGQKGSALWAEAHELIGHMLTSWPRQAGYFQPQDNSKACQLLTLLARLQDAEHITAMIPQVIAAGVHNKGENAALLAALGLLPASQAGELLAQVVQANAARGLGACADLLRQAVLAGFVAEHLQAAASALVEALPGDPARPAPADYALRPQAVDAQAIADLMAALCCIDSGLADRAAAHLLAWPQTYDLDALLVPASRRWAATPRCAATPYQPEVFKAAPVQRLCAACRAHLEARLALALAPPGDWRRASALPCRCQYCSELARFLDSPDQRIWRFKAAELARKHVLSSIRSANGDVDSVTDKTGSPHALVCTKNQASYERRVVQRRQDLEDLAGLGQAAAGGG